MRKTFALVALASLFGLASIAGVASADVPPPGSDLPEDVVECSKTRFAPADPKPVGTRCVMPRTQQPGTCRSAACAAEDGGSYKCTQCVAEVEAGVDAGTTPASTPSGCDLGRGGREASSAGALIVLGVAVLALECRRRVKTPAQISE